MTKERPTQCGHEDSGVRGRAHDNALRTRDFRLVHWIPPCPWSRCAGRDRRQPVSRKVQPFQDSGDQAADPADEVIDLAAHPLRRSCTAEHRSQVVAVYEEAAFGQNAAVLRQKGLYQPQVRE